MRKCAAAIFAAMAILALAACSAIFPPDYAAVIKLNWGIDLPAGCEEVYSLDSGASPHGDGVRYHVMSCPESTDIEAFADWSHGADISVEAQEYLDCLSVPQGERPPYDRCVCIRYAKDLDTMILLWDASARRLYIIESFI